MEAPTVSTLRRQIGFLGTISLSVGVMAPTLAMSLTGVQASSLIGRAAPLALVVVIFVKLAAGAAPRGLGYSSAFLHIPSGVGLSTIVFAASAGFLSFAGFEAAGSFGEESERPTHTIPRSIVAAIAFGSVFYVVCMVAQTLGFGTDAAGIRAFSHSGAPLGDLGKSYLDSAAADVLDLVAILSAVGAGLGCASVGARMLFAL